MTARSLHAESAAGCNPGAGTITRERTTGIDSQIFPKRSVMHRATTVECSVVGVVNGPIFANNKSAVVFRVGDVGEAD